jgi:NMD protein affecting ribosome stability and mRNA decay
MAKCSKCGETSNPAKAKFCAKCGKEMKSVATKKVETTFENKCHILGDMWMSMRDAEDFEEFFEYNDLGLPLAYVLDNDMAVPNKKSHEFVNETFDLLLEQLEIEDSGFEELDELLNMAE